MNLQPALPLAIAAGIQAANSGISFLLAFRTRGTLGEIDKLQLEVQDSPQIRVKERISLEKLRVKGITGDGRVISNSTKYISQVISRDKDVAAAVFGVVAIAIAGIGALARGSLAVDGMTTAIIVFGAMVVGIGISILIARTEPEVYAGRTKGAFSWYTLVLLILYVVAAAVVVVVSPNAP